MRGRPQAEDPGTRHCNGRTIFMNRMLALAAAGALVLSGCGESGAPADVQKKTVLEYASMKDIRNINPHLYLGEMAAQAMVFEPLVFNTPEGRQARACRALGDFGRRANLHLSSAPGREVHGRDPLYGRCRQEEHRRGAGEPHAPCMA